MTARARTRRKHQRRCENCRHLFAPVAGFSACKAVLCPKCLGEGAKLAEGTTAAPWPEGKALARLRRQHGLGGPPLAPAHRKHVRPHRPGKERP